MYIKEQFWMAASKEHQMVGFSKGNIKFSMHIHSLKVNNKIVETNYVCSKLMINKLGLIWEAKS